MAVEIQTCPEQQGQEHQEGGLQSASSHNSAPPARQRMRLVAGAIVLALLLLILIPTIIPLMLAWCVVEVLFYMLKSRPEAASLDAQPQPHWPDAAARHDLSAFNRFLRYSQEAPDRVDYTKYLSGWFLGADVASIRRENVEEFVSYGFCYKSRCVSCQAGYASVVLLLLVFSVRHWVPAVVCMQQSAPTHHHLCLPAYVHLQGAACSGGQGRLGQEDDRPAGAHLGH